MKLEPIKVSSKQEVPEDLPTDITITEVCKGLKTWKNPDNKFFVGRLHYSADPRKRTKDWKEAASSGIPFAEWMREYEIVWSSFEGVPVYVDHYAREFHVSKEPIQWAMQYPVIRGWDFGLDVLGMACIFTQLLSHSRLFVYRELLASDTDIDTFCEAVKKQSFEWFPGCVKWFDLVDPTGFNRNAAAKEKRSYVDAVNKHLKTRCIPGERTRVRRIKSVIDFLKANIKGQPKILIDGTNCPILVEGFDGGYHYAYNKQGEVKDEPEKNSHSHSHDALQMVCSRVETLNMRDEPTTIPAVPKYNFGRVA